MAQPNSTTTTITGVVESANERGVKINGGWLNVSKYKPSKRSAPLFSGAGRGLAQPPPMG